MERPKQLNIKFNVDKYRQYFLEQVHYLGMISTKNGTLPDPDKIESINKFEKTKNELQKFLSMEDYLGNI